LATKVKTKGVSTQVPKTGDYVQVSLVCLIGSERELDLKGFCKHTGRNYSDDIYKVETIKPRKVSHNEFLLVRPLCGYRANVAWVTMSKEVGNCYQPSFMPLSY